MQHQRHHVIRHALLDIRHRPADAHFPAGGLRHRVKQPNLRLRDGERIVHRFGIRQRQITHLRDILRRRHKHREQPAGKAALAHPGIIQMAAFKAAEYRPDRLGLRAQPQAQQQIVMAVKHGRERSVKGVHRRSEVKKRLTYCGMCEGRLLKRGCGLGEGG
ncbi:hypothetical protein BN131_3157 [Cronobacter malonaticus 681]|nr:hypothetical protein BN131_3157 [Cronobacter malonaticus 681]